MIKYIYSQANGMMGSHLVKNPKVFIVLQREGRLRGEGATRTPIQVWQPVFWDRGLWHETSIDLGMAAIQIERETFALNQSLLEG